MSANSLEITNVKYTNDDTLSVGVETSKSLTDDEQTVFRLNIDTVYLLLWRVIASLLFLTMIIIDLIRFKEELFLFIIKTLSYWGVICTMAYTISSAIIQPEKTGRIKYLSIFFAFIFSINLVISLTYWALLYPYINFPSLFDNILGAINHSQPLIITVIDFIINRYRVHLYLNIIFSFTAILLYGIINIIFTFAEDEPVYVLLDWVSWQSYVFILGILIIMMIGIIMNWGFSKLKMKKKTDTDTDTDK